MGLLWTMFRPLLKLVAMWFLCLCVQLLWNTNRAVRSSSRCSHWPTHREWLSLHCILWIGTVTGRQKWNKSFCITIDGHWAFWVSMLHFLINAVKWWIIFLCFQCSKAEFISLVLHFCRSGCIPVYLLCGCRLMKLVHVLERLSTKEWNVVEVTLKSQPCPSSLGVFSLAPALHCPCCTSPRWAMCPI